MQTLGRLVGVVKNYDELHLALRARAEELDVSREILDELSGLPAGYVGKLLAPAKYKTLGMTSLVPLLGALGLQIALIEDLDAIANMKTLLGQRQSAQAHCGAAHWRYRQAV